MCNTPPYLQVLRFSLLITAALVLGVGWIPQLDLLLLQQVFQFCLRVLLRHHLWGGVERQGQVVRGRGRY